MTVPVTCAFVGLGSQGAPIAQRMLAAGLPVRLWARRPQTLEAFAGTSAQAVEGLADLASADHIAICVVDDAGVREICEGLLPSVAPGARVVIHSTVDPSLCRELALRFARRGAVLIDAPVSGGAPAAAAGTMTVMVGGETAAVEAARPVFETFAARVFHLGGVGSGQLAKLVNNTMMAAHVTIADHALTAADQLGLDRSAFVDLVKTSSGRSFGFEVFASKPSIAGFAHGAALLEKDVRLLGGVLASHPSFVALNQLTGEFLARARKASEV